MVTAIAPKRAKKATPQPSVSTANLGGIEDPGGFRAILYGPSGVGKSSMLAHAPRPGFIIDPQEQGILWLVKRGIVPRPAVIKEADSFNRLIELLDEVRKWGISDLALDGLTGIEKLCFQHHCREYFSNDWTQQGFYSYQQGPKNAAKTDWPAFLDALNEVCRTGVNVWLLGHTRVKEYKNPTGPNYDRHYALADDAIWGATHQWAQAVLFYNYKVTLEIDPGNKKKRKVEVDGVEGHFIHTQYSPAFDAKNQLGLPPVIDGGNDGKEAYAAFAKALAA